MVNRLKKLRGKYKLEEYFYDDVFKYVHPESKLFSLDFVYIFQGTQGMWDCKVLISQLMHKTKCKYRLLKRFLQRRSGESKRHERKLVLYPPKHRDWLKTKKR